MQRGGVPADPHATIGRSLLILCRLCVLSVLRDDGNLWALSVQFLGGAQVVRLEIFKSNRGEAGK